MKVTPNSNFTNLEGEEFQKQVSIYLDQLAGTFNGQISFHANMDVKNVTVAFPKANVSIKVPHNLGRLPKGYIKISGTANITVFDGNKANTAKEIYVQSSGVGTATLMLI